MTTYTKEQILKAAELGEVSQIDANHIVSLLDDAVSLLNEKNWSCINCINSFNYPNKLYCGKNYNLDNGNCKGSEFEPEPQESTLITIKERYDQFLTSGMFWKLYPQLTGTWKLDRKMFTKLYSKLKTEKRKTTMVIPNIVKPKDIIISHKEW